MTVQLAVVPHEQQHLIVIGTTVRKSPQIVAAWLQSLAWQVPPKQTQRFYLFLDDGSPPETRQLLNEFVAKHGGLVWDAEPAPQVDFADNGPTHHWTNTAMDRVGRSKDRILDFARVNRAEAVWFTDSDLVMDPMTLSSLWSIPEQIVSGCYWTRWNKVPAEHPPVHAGPQVWLTHPYGLQGNGLEEWEFRDRLINRQVTQVFGQGACTLIRAKMPDGSPGAILRGVSFAPWSGNQMSGIGQGEDRHFCMRAEHLHIRMVCDPWPDIWHCYHPEDVALIPEMVDRLKMQGRWAWDELGNPVPDHYSPKLGDLISVELTALETIPTHTGPMRAPTRFVRGRLGKVGLVPELEDAVLQMERGEVRVVPVHFPLSYPFAPYRGQRRIIRLTLHDHKPHGFAPVIETELITNRIGSAIDTVTCPPELLEDMKEVYA
jgi:hypothetical protein